MNDSQGNPRAFWSITLYQPDTTQSAAPFITQASVLNTAYSTANVAVTAVDASTDTIMVRPSAWGPLEASTPILFGSTAARYGLTPGVPYYVATTPTRKIDPKTKRPTYSFKVSTKWLQKLSAADVPIQGNTGAPGPVVNLTNPGGPVNLHWGPIQPVSQLGSQQLTSGKLVKNADGSATIWLAPTLPAGAHATNWIPTPSTAYYESVYGVSVVPLIRPIMRVYYPTPEATHRPRSCPRPTGRCAPPTCSQPSKRSASVGGDEPDPATAPTDACSVAKSDRRSVPTLGMNAIHAIGATACVGGGSLETAARSATKPVLVNGCGFDPVATAENLKILSDEVFAPARS